MAYTAQTWTNGVSKLNATRMTVIETGIADIHNLVDAKGDLYTATAADTPARLAVGANDRLLVADSAQATGLKWANITNSMVDAAAAIAYSKLNLAASIVNADIASAAAIDVSKLAGAFSTYVPVWGSTGTAPALNNGTIAGRYIQIGKLVFFKILLTIGSTSTFGTAAWKFTLPVTASSSISQNGFVRSVDASASQAYHGGCNIEPTNGAVVSTFASPIAFFDGTVPFAWAASDTLEISGTYEAA